MSQQIQFVQLTQEEYDLLQPKVPGRLYFTTNTHKIYKGSQLYATGEVPRHTHDADELNIDDIEVGSIEASSIKVDGKDVSLEGHVHDVSEIDGLQDLLNSVQLSKEDIFMREED